MHACEGIPAVEPSPEDRKGSHSKAKVVKFLLQEGAQVLYYDEVHLV